MWYTAEIIRNIKYKAKLRLKLKKTGNNIYKEEFSNLRALIKNQISVAYENYLSNIQNSISSNPKKFWNFVNTKNRTSRIPGEMNYGTSRLQSPQEIVNGFASFFSSIFASSELENFQPSEFFNNFGIINLRNITEIELIRASRKLQNKFTAGPDQIPAFVVKDCIGAFITPLLKIFNLSMITNTFPEIWKTSRICPIHKTGTVIDLENYRAVTILDNFAKLLEIVIYNRIYISVRNVISPYQHGFMTKRSTMTNLTIFTQYVSEQIDKNGQVDVIFTDFAKAFDKLDHCILIQKLSTFGLDVHSLQLLKSYLLGRKQFVSYNGFQSPEFEATSGVPQGSNLGPLLFNLFINDLFNIVDCGKLAFADDLKIYSTINSLEDCSFLQSQLDNVYIWCLQNKIFLNPTKCKSMTFTRRKNISVCDYLIEDATLERMKEIKDLGIYYDSSLTFSSHISKKTGEAMKAYGFIVRNCREFSNMKAYLTLYYSFVRSKLEYGSIIWYPFYNCYKISLERVQRRFLKFLAFKNDRIYPERGFPYNNLLSKFDVISLETRRKCACISFLYKIIHNKIDAIDILSQINFYVPPLRTRSSLPFYCTRARTNLNLKSPVYVMCTSYNMISHDCDIYNDNLRNIIKTAEQRLVDNIL